MKKFYTAMAMLACAAVASAFTTNGLVPTAANKAKVETQNALNLKTIKSIKPIDVTTHQGMRKAGEEWNEVGQGYFDDNILTYETLSVEIQESASTSCEFQLVAPWAEYGSDVNLQIDATNPQVVKIPFQSTGVYDSEWGEVWIVSFSGYLAENGYDDDEIVTAMEDEEIEQIDYLVDEKMIYIPGYSMLLYYPDYDPSNLYYATDYSIIYFPGATLEWEDVDTEAVFVDGIMPPMYSEAGGQVTSTVTIQKNNYTENYYRVLKPWAGCFAALDANIPGSPLYLDATYPECVVAPLTYAGFSDADMGAVYVMSMSYNNGVGYEDGQTVEEYLNSANAQYNITLETLADGSQQFKFTPNAIWFYFPQGDSEHIYYTRASEEATITFKENAGIGSVAADNDAEAVYYNIQGMQVANPEAGHLYIVKQGSKVSKQIMR